MPAACDECHKRRRKLRLLNVVGADVSKQMMDPDQRDILRESHRLGSRHADQQCADQPRSAGHADEVNLIQRRSRFVQCLPHDMVDVFEVVSGGNLRYHAAVVFKNIYLR